MSRGCLLPASPPPAARGLPCALRMLCAGGSPAAAAAAGDTRLHPARSEALHQAVPAACAAPAAPGPVAPALPAQVVRALALKLGSLTPFAEHDERVTIFEGTLRSQLQALEAYLPRCGGVGGYNHGHGTCSILHAGTHGGH